MLRKSKSILLLIAAAAVCTHASAHTGHGTQSLMQGLLHPFGADHLLAMLAVGLWSVSSLPDRRVWQGPATFLLFMLTGALVAGTTTALPYLEPALALSVTLLGVLLVAGRRVSRPQGLTLIALDALLHGAGHGAESPAHAFAVYAVGFLVSTAALHLGGVTIGLGIRQLWAERRKEIGAGLGALIGAGGLYLVTPF